MKRTCRIILIVGSVFLSILLVWMVQAWRESTQTENEESYTNAYILSVSGTSLTVIYGEKKELQTATSVSGESLQGIVADIRIKNGKVLKISRKPEYITGTVQKKEDNSLTIDDYGTIPLDENFTLYYKAKDGTVRKGDESEIYVGQPDVWFAVAQNRICAAVVPEKTIDRIRVILHNNDFSGYDHENVKITATSDFYVTIGGKTTQYKKGETIVADSSALDSEMIVGTQEKGKIRILTLKRQCGKPEYRGILRVSKSGKALHLINEVSLEEYLYSVVPSEMPSEYPTEALKAQAVCARSYATGQIQGNRLAKYGAHADDGTSFQMYGNQKEEKRTTEAVKATKNIILSYQGKTAATYFYSTSCGSCAGTKDVWFTKNNVSYLPAFRSGETGDLSKEEAFRRFIKNTAESPDDTSPWYRWQAEVPWEVWQKTIEQNLESCSKTCGDRVQVKQSDNTFCVAEVSAVGRIENISIVRRGKGGVACVAEITGQKQTVRIYTEYYIRKILGNNLISYKRGDGQTTEGLRILPSGFFCIEKKEDLYRIYGGGYGHGVGMSQNGAASLAKNGKTYHEILSYYYPGTEEVCREADG